MKRCEEVGRNTYPLACLAFGFIAKSFELIVGRFSPALAVPGCTNPKDGFLPPFRSLCNPSHSLVSSSRTAEESVLTRVHSIFLVTLSYGLARVAVALRRPRVACQGRAHPKLDE